MIERRSFLAFSAAAAIVGSIPVAAAVPPQEIVADGPAMVEWDRLSLRTQTFVLLDLWREKTPRHRQQITESFRAGGHSDLVKLADHMTRMVDGGMSS